MPQTPTLRTQITYKKKPAFIAEWYENILSKGCSYIAEFITEKDDNLL